MKHIDITFDFETCSTAPDAAPMQLAAIVWNRFAEGEHPFTEDTFDVGIDLRTCVVEGFAFDQDTVNFWSRQNDMAKQNVTETECYAVDTAFMQFCEWIEQMKKKYGADTVCLWCQGQDFDFPILKTIARKFGLKIFGWTLTGRDELEPNASPNAERIAAMKRMSDKGYLTWASIEPVIDFKSSLEMICQALDAGCKHFKIGLLTNKTRVCREKYNVDDCVDFITRVMIQTRGKATVYWKQSARDFIRTSRKPALTDEEVCKVFDSWPNSVGKDFSIFTSNGYGK